MLSLLKKARRRIKFLLKIQATYGRYRMQALLSVFLGYLAYYIVRNNFTLSTPYLKEQLDLSATQIGLLSSCMLIAYGISKGVMSSLADKASPKVFMACGLVLCAIVNVGLGFSTAFWVFAALVVLNGLFQGMGSALFITIANWFPRRERGRVGRSGTFPITSAAELSPRSSAPHSPFSAPSTGRAPATLYRPAWRWYSPLAYWCWVRVRRARKVCLRWQR